MATSVLFSAPPEEDSDSVDPAPKPNWGKIETTQFVLEPPDELLDEPLYYAPSLLWAFPLEWDSEKISHFFRESGLDEDFIEKFLTQERILKPGVAVGYVPTREMVLQLSNRQREALYTRLGQWDFNPYHSNPFEFGTMRLTDVAEMAPHAFPKEFISQADKLVYQIGRKHVFADYAAMAGPLPDELARLDFAKLLLRTRCHFARMNPFANEEAAEIIRYWSARNRNLDVVPILEAAARSKGRDPINLIHLLPPIPRSLVFTFPPPQSMVGTKRPDCFWTAHNFFTPEISQRYLDVTFEDSDFEGWLPIEPPYELGDVILVVDQANPEKIYHACNYVADDLVFTKNGTSRIRPWVLQTLDDMKSVYFREGETKLIFLRREEFVENP
ncbi:MAG: hypothetical protein KDN19_10250 [Verrucomicrobiae bacterium]|nr:hypothetical protein [Verrucomicrobiae bacterium]